jgi:glycosyltransferase involved in cell wall biosynthesis
MRDRIEFFKAGSFSGMNPVYAAILRAAFPACEVRVTDALVDVILRSPTTVVLALAEIALARPRLLIPDPRFHLLRTRAAQRAIRRRVRRGVDPGRTLCTFQTQSLFGGARAGVPHVVCTDHTARAAARYPAPWNRTDGLPAWLTAEPEFYREADLILSQSTFARMSLIEDYGIDPDKVVCTYSGATALGALAADPPARERAPRTILFVGVEWERKGGPDLLAAFERVTHAFPDARLIIAGVSIASPSSRVTVLGRIPPAELARWFAEADVFCLPSRKEPAALVLAEAALAGLPVVATQVGGNPDRVIDGETGFLVPPGDVGALARRLEGLLGSAETCRAMGRAGRALALDRFTWERVGQRSATAIRALLGQPDVPFASP